MRVLVAALLATAVALPAAAQQAGSGATGPANADQTRVAPPTAAQPTMNSTDDQARAPSTTPGASPPTMDSEDDQEAQAPSAATSTTPSPTTMIGHPAQPSGPGFAELKSQDQKFVQDAAVGGIAEVEAGKLAQANAASEAVKDFGRRMVEDHGKANAKLAEWAKEKNVTLPTALDGDRQKMQDQLRGMRGVDFDQAYVNGQVADHRKTAELLQRQITSGDDPQLKAFAAETLPVVQDHQKMLESLASQVLVGKK